MSRMRWVLGRRSRVSAVPRSASTGDFTDSRPLFYSRCASLGSRDKVAVRLALAHHFLAIGIEGVIHNPLGGVLLVVVLETEGAEALSDGLQSRPLVLVPERVVGICAVHALAQQNHRWISPQSYRLW